MLIPELTLSIAKTPDVVPLDALGSHPLECVARHEHRAVRQCGRQLEAFPLGHPRLRVTRDPLRVLRVTRVLRVSA